VSCQTVLDAEMFVEMPTTTFLVNLKDEHEVHLDSVTSDTAVVQYLVSDVGLRDLNLLLKSSCAEDCNVTVHVTAEDNLACTLLNNSTTLSFKSFVGRFHYVILRLLSGNATNVTMRVLENDDEPRTNGSDQVTLVDLSRKSFPEFFLFDYEHLRANDTKPQSFNVTSDALSVLGFDIGRVYDVGGTVTLGFKLIDVEERYKKNIVLVACVSLGQFLCLALNRFARRQLRSFRIPKRMTD